MTEREKVIALAGVVGWPCVGFYDEDRKGETFPRLVEQYGKPAGERDWFLIDGKGGRTWSPREIIADAFEVQAKIPQSKRMIYRRAVQDEIANHNPRQFVNDHELLFATARQRMDAILVALELDR